MEAIGKRIWAIAEGYIPAYSHGEFPDLKATKPPASSIPGIRKRM
jgi:hypothetical protein